MRVCCRYIVHFDEQERFGGAALRPLWNAISARMRALLPHACEVLREKLEDAGVRERLRSREARHVRSVGTHPMHVHPPPHACASMCTAHEPPRAGMCTRTAAGTSCPTT